MTQYISKQHKLQGVSMEMWQLSMCLVYFLWLRSKNTHQAQTFISWVSSITYFMY